MSYTHSRHYPDLTPQSQEGYWNKFQIARACNLKVPTISRYLSAAGIVADKVMPIKNRNRHDAAHYTNETFLKFLRWMSNERREM